MGKMMTKGDDQNVHVIICLSHLSKYMISGYQPARADKHRAGITWSHMQTWGYHEKYRSKYFIIGNSNCLNTKITDFLTLETSNEPPRGKTSNVVSDQVRHKPTCAVTEDS